MQTNAKPARSERPLWFLGFLLALFIACVLGAWLWVELGQPTQTDAYWIEAKTHLEGRQYRPNELTRETLDQLGTTNTLNGAFTNRDGYECSVFMATWDEEQGKRLSAVAHTPDLCWTYLGWKPLDLGQPKQVSISLNGVEIPFECRIFESKAGTREMAVWCSLLGGSVMRELDILRVNPDDINTRYTDHGSRSVTMRRRWKIAQFVGLITHRLPTRGNRQFARYSMPLRDDWQTQLEQLKQFGPEWLTLHRKKASRQ